MHEVTPGAVGAAAWRDKYQGQNGFKISTRDPILATRLGLVVGVHADLAHLLGEGWSMGWLLQGGKSRKRFLKSLSANKFLIETSQSSKILLHFSTYWFNLHI